MFSNRIVTLVLSCVLSALSFSAASEDIDIFSVDENSVVGKPNILIVLDNSSNWSRQAQQWPSGGTPVLLPNGTSFLSDNSGSPTQGQSEARAIIRVLQKLSSGAVNMGLLEFSTAGNSNTNQTGYVRQHIVEMTGSIGDPSTNKGRFAARLKQIYENINAPIEKKDSNNAFGTLMWDIYNYLGGLAPSRPGINPTPVNADLNIGADVAGYTDANFVRFASPLGDLDACRRTIVIFIGNNTSSGPSNDDSATTVPGPIKALDDLATAEGFPDATDELKFAEYAVVTPNPPQRVTNLGLTNQCYRNESGCRSALSAGTPSVCVSDHSATNCDCVTPISETLDSGASCPNNEERYTVSGDIVTFEPTGRQVSPPNNSRWSADEWARFLAQIGVPVTIGVTADNPDGVEVRVPAATYTIDVFNAQQDPNFSALLRNMADVSRGKYYQARNEADIEAALLDILSEAQAVNTAFSSASLPVSATNRAQSENQVFIGLFRPDRTASPRWFGNLKRYQVVRDGTTIQLGDKDGRAAINDETGFLAECAASFWTQASLPTNFWQTVITDNPDARSLCETSNTPWSDLPDGPYVEKGAAAGVLRRGSGTADANDNFTLSRTVRTQRSDGTNTLVPFDRGNVAAGVSDEVLAFTLGQDRLDDDRDGNQTEPRSTIHGDVIHSRPQPVNYGDATKGIVVYYGANDGTLRAVDADDGRELWSFIAREHFDKLERLHRNEPKVKYFNNPATSSFEVEIVTGTDANGNPITTTTTQTFNLEPKDYFFDGSIGLLQNEDSSVVRIYPSMRRGGRMVYAFDVTTPTAPVLLWKKGCPLGWNDAGTVDDTGCAAGFSGIGQTWSLPSPITIMDATDNPIQVVAFGGGYDICEDDHGPFGTQVTPANCGASPKGREVFILNALTGEKLTVTGNDQITASLAADLAFVDVDNDEVVDFAYAADTAGGIYRVTFGDVGAIEVDKIAQTAAAAGRKFLFPPALLLTRLDDVAPPKPVVYLAIGSGDREHPLRSQYVYANDVLNRFYVFKDLPTDAAPETPLALDTALVDQNDPDVEGDCFAEAITPASSSKGWYIDLNENAPNADGRNGEQVVTSAVIAGGRVFFSTNQPSAEAEVSSALACTNDLGIARGYALDVLTGAGPIAADGGCGERSEEFTGGGLPPPPVTAEVPVCNADGTGCRTESICIGCIIPGGCGTGSPLQACDIRVDTTPVRQRLYWYTLSDTE
jgi:type IV pilus assembly protein PilY1